MAIREINENHLQGVTQFGEVVSEARRKGPGTLWYVFLTHHRKGRGGRNETPHVRISGKLNEQVQLRLVFAALSATTGIKETPCQ